MWEKIRYRVANLKKKEFVPFSFLICGIPFAGKSDIFEKKKIEKKNAYINAFNYASWQP